MPPFTSYLVNPLPRIRVGTSMLLCERWTSTLNCTCVLKTLGTQSAWRPRTFPDPAASSPMQIDTGGSWDSSEKEIGVSCRQLADLTKVTPLVQSQCGGKFQGSQYHPSQVHSKHSHNMENAGPPPMTVHFLWTEARKKLSLPSACYGPSHREQTAVQ